MLASAAATGIATAAQWAFNSAVLANPITWIIVGIVALIAAIVLLIANWDTVVKFITDTWSKFMSWIKPALDAVGKWWSGLWSGVKSFVVSVWTAVSTWVVAKFTALKAGLLTIGNGIRSWWSGLWSGIKSVAVNIWNTIKSAASNSFNAVVGTIKSVVGGVKSLWNNLVSWVGGLPGRIGSAVSGMWNGILSGFKGVLNGVIGLWNNLSFKVPGLEVFGHKVGGFTLSTPNLPYFEKGTNYFGGGPAIVGENGPEIVNLPSGASVTNASGTERALSGGGDTYVTNNNVTIVEAEDPLGSAGRVDSVLRKWSKK
jgi:phage-related protein